jgi:hypothetical protein
MKTNSPFQLIEESIANPKYNLNKALSLIFDGESYYERNLKNYYFICIDGDAFIEGNLQLDYLGEWATNSLEWRRAFNISYDDTMTQNFGVRGLIVNGHLTVNGSIINSDGDNGPFLYVTGNVQANNLVSGGAFMQICGDAKLSGVAYGHYNDGYIGIAGDLSCPVYISEDHAFSIDGKLVNNLFNYNSFDDSQDKDETEIKDEYDDYVKVISPKLRQLLRDDIETWDDIKPFLCAGYDVMRKSDDLAVVKNAAYWHKRVAADWHNFEHVPKMEISPALCLTAVEQHWGALYKVPDEFKTAELVKLAVSKNGHALECVSKKLITLDLCNLASKSYSGLIFTPQEFITEEMALKSVKFEEKELNYLTKEMANIVRKKLNIKEKSFLISKLFGK